MTLGQQDDPTLATSNRQLSAPADLERSRRVRGTARSCQPCDGPWLRELSAGPVVSHAHDCISLP